MVSLATEQERRTTFLSDFRHYFTLVRDSTPSVLYAVPPIHVADCVHTTMRSIVRFARRAQALDSVVNAAEENNAEGMSLAREGVL